jgi:hypothetical protein
MQPELALKPFAMRVEKCQDAQTRGASMKSRKEMSTEEREVNYHKRLVKAGLPSPWQVVRDRLDDRGRVYVRRYDYSALLGDRSETGNRNPLLCETPHFAAGALYTSSHPTGLQKEALDPPHMANESSYSEMDTQLQTHSRDDHALQRGPQDWAENAVKAGQHSGEARFRQDDRWSDRGIPIVGGYCEHLPAIDLQLTSF